MFDCLQSRGPQHARLPCLSLSPRVGSDSCPQSPWCYPTISSSATLFSFCLQPFPASGFFPLSQLFTSGGQVLELQHQSFQWKFRVDFLYGWLIWSLFSSRDSQESSPAPWFEGIHFMALRCFLLWAVTSIHDYWKTHSFDNTEFCRQSNVSAL